MDEREMRSSLRRAGERLYGDSRLRDGLSDEQAKRLLAWGFSQVEKVVEDAQLLPAVEARERIESRTKLVRETVLLVGQMVTRLPAASRERSREYAIQLAEALRAMDGRALEADEILALASASAGDEAAPSSLLFRRLLALVRAAPAGEDMEVKEPATGSRGDARLAAAAGDHDLVLASNALAASAETEREEEE